MIGLPFQTVEDLANDLLFMKQFDIDMCGMGPYIEHAQTPLYKNKSELLSLRERFNLSLKMVALLRILMPDINIAATTALQTLAPDGREQGLRFGANVIMPQATPNRVRRLYTLYDGKPCLDDGAKRCANCLEARISSVGRRILRDDWGDSARR